MWGGIHRQIMMKKSKMCIGIIGTVLSTLMIVYTFLMIVFQQLFGGTGDKVASGLCAGASVLVLAGAIALIVNSDSRKSNIVSAVLFVVTSAICIIYPSLRTLGVLAATLTVVLLFVLVLGGQSVKSQNSEKDLEKAEKKYLPLRRKAKEEEKKGNTEE